MSAAFLVTEGVANRVQSEAAIDDRAKASGFEAAHKVDLMAPASDGQGVQPSLLGYYGRYWHVTAHAGQHADDRDVSADRRFASQ